MSINTRFSQRGVSMIEVLISLVIVSTVMLAVALYSMTGLSENQSAYYRSQANLLAYDIADRIRGNVAYALANDANYSFDTSTSAVPAAPNCIATTAGCSEDELANQDLREWAENFVDVASLGNNGADYESKLPDGVGTVAVNGATNRVTITVSWQELDWNTSGGGTRDESTAQLQIDFMIFN